MFQKPCVIIPLSWKINVVDNITQRFRTLSIEILWYCSIFLTKYKNYQNIATHDNILLNVIYYSTRRVRPTVWLTCNSQPIAGRSAQLPIWIKLFVRQPLSLYFCRDPNLKWLALYPRIGLVIKKALIIRCCLFLIDFYLSMRVLVLLHSS